MRRVFWGRGALGSLVTRRLNNLTPEGLAIYESKKGILAAVTRQCTFRQAKSHEKEQLKLSH